MGNEIHIVTGIQQDIPYWENEQHIWGLALTVIFGLILLCMIVHSILKWMRCSVNVDAEIIELHHTTSTDSDGFTTDQYAPEYCYYYEGQEYRVRSAVYSNGKQYQIGQHVTLYINPEKPEKFYDRRRDLKNGLFIGIVIAIFFAIGIGLLKSA